MLSIAPAVRDAYDELAASARLAALALRASADRRITSLRCGIRGCCRCDAGYRRSAEAPQRLPEAFLPG